MDYDDDIPGQGWTEISSCSACPNPSTCTCFGSGLCESSHIYIELRLIYDMILWSGNDMSDVSPGRRLYPTECRDVSQPEEALPSDMGSGYEQSITEQEDYDDAPRLASSLVALSLRTVGSAVWLFRRIRADPMLTLLVTNGYMKTPIILVACELRWYECGTNSGQDAYVSPGGYHEAHLDLLKGGWFPMLDDKTTGVALYMRPAEEGLDTLMDLLKVEGHDILLEYNYVSDSSRIPFAPAPCLNYRDKARGLLLDHKPTDIGQARTAKVTIVITAPLVSVHGGGYPSTFMPTCHVLDLAIDP